jgi:hypothetical protein
LELKKCAWWKINYLYNINGDVDSTIPGGDEVCTVEDQFGDTESMVM